MTSRSLFALDGREEAAGLDDEVHRHLGPLIAEFIATGSLARVEWTLERITRGVAVLNYPPDAGAERRCGAALKAIIGARRRNTRVEPIGMEAKVVEWMRAGWADSRDSIDAWLAEQAESGPLDAARPVMAAPFSWTDPASLPARAWLYGRHLIRGEVSATLAPGGVGKTSLAVVEALAMATGWPLLGHEPPDQLRVWLFNGEEPLEELHRRIGAAMKHFGIPPDAIGDRLFVTSGLDRPIVLAEESRDGTKVHVPLMHELIGELRAQMIDVMLVDPFISTHSVSENDNNAIQKVASAWKEVAVGANVAIGLGHHVRKLAGRDATTEDSRGADALISKVRDGRVLNVMSEAEAAKLGVLANDRFGYIWTGPGGKSNMSARTGTRAWFRLVGVDLGNGDSVAVVEQWKPPHVGDEIEPERLAKLGTIMGERQWRAAKNVTDSPEWVGAAVADAFNLGGAEGWKLKAKALIGELERRGVIVRAATLGANRKLMPVFVFRGGADE